MINDAEGMMRYDHEKEFHFLLPGRQAYAMTGDGRMLVVTRLVDGSLAAIWGPEADSVSMPMPDMLVIYIQQSEDMDRDRLNAQSTAEPSAARGAHDGDVVVIKPFVNATGVTVAELQAWLATVPTTDPVTGDPNTVWMGTGPGVSSPVRAIWPLNARVDRGRIVSCDVCLEDDVERDRLDAQSTADPSEARDAHDGDGPTAVVHRAYHEEVVAGLRQEFAACGRDVAQLRYDNDQWRQKFNALVAVEAEKMADIDALKDVRDALRARLVATAQILIAAVGSNGPTNANEVAMRAVTRIRELEAAREALAQRVRLAVNEWCSCGGCGPDDSDCCPACQVWHAVMGGQHG